MGRRFVPVALAPRLDTFHGFEQHLPDHDRQHRFAQPGNQHGAEVEHVPADAQIAGQPIPAGGRVFIVGRHRDVPRIRNRLIPAPATDLRPNIASNDVGDGLCVGVFNRGLSPPRPHVQRLTLRPGERGETLANPGKEFAMVFLCHESAEKLLIVRRAQLARQLLHEVR
ncbi:hypothetical protein D3C84_445120 [compost metagenome]